jgi:hypothetical protein
MPQACGGSLAARACRSRAAAGLPQPVQLRSRQRKELADPDRERRHAAGVLDFLRVRFFDHLQQLREMERAGALQGRNNLFQRLLPLLHLRAKSPLPFAPVRRRMVPVETALERKFQPLAIERLRGNRPVCWPLADRCRAPPSP